MKAKVKEIKYYANVIPISGAKNSALPIICASILCDEEVILNNIPDIEDTKLLIDIMNSIGYQIKLINNTLIIPPIKNINNYIRNKKVSKLRGSYYFIGALMGKMGKLKILHPGGCNLGNRPINYHLDAFRNMNATIKESKKYLKIEGNLIATTHELEFPSVGATINILLASVHIQGSTIISNAAMEPEVTDVCNFLVSMGAKIEGIGTRCLHIQGVKHFKKTNYTIISDRIEAGTFLILGAMHKGITITNIDYTTLTSLINVLKNCGCEISCNHRSITLKRNKPLIPFSIRIGTYPDFPTDLGPQIEGISYLDETIYTKRFSHIVSLKKMGADFYLNDTTLHIHGYTPLHQAELDCYDLRCSAALLLATTLCKNYSVINHIEILFRGYENIEQKLASLGIDFQLMK